MFTRRFLSAAGCLVWLLLMPLPARALVVEGYTPEVNDRFASGFSDKPVPNRWARFVGRGYDWSGVGWRVEESEYSVTMVTPRHFLCAAHYPPQANGTVAFLNRDGELKTYIVQGIAKVPQGTDAQGKPVMSDLAVGTLVQPIPESDHITHYRVLYLGPTITRYLGQEVLMYGKTARIGVNSIVDGLLIRGLSAEFKIENTGLLPGMAMCESGDSGSGSFIPYQGELTLAGVHRTKDADTLVAGLIAETNKILATDGYKLSVIDASK